MGLGSFKVIENGAVR